MKPSSNLTPRDTQQAREQAWLARYQLYEADVEFRRARLRSIRRWLAGLLFTRRNSNGKSVPATLAHGETLVTIDAIVGTVNGCGEEIPRLPVLRRTHLDEWRRVFTLDVDDAYRPLAVSRGTGGWYLRGGSADLIVLEVLRAKLHDTVRVVAASPAPDCRQRNWHHADRRLGSPIARSSSKNKIAAPPVASDETCGARMDGT